MQDAQIGTIIGHGTKKRGLYYVDKAVQKGHTSFAHGFPNHQLWMALMSSSSLEYVKRLFPSLFNCNESLNFESYV